MSNEELKKEVAIRLSGVKKRYKLGQIGGGTLTADLQSWWAKIRGKDDPNVPIGMNQRLVGQTFMALNGIDLTVYKGEALGIIGSNGAGKSTMLKLLCRITAPTEGQIDIYGRIASMLEVGTGFNGEMTGRENIYMNGTILGMTKAEIDAKMEDIIAFSEVRDFIDTPVKRYSSGMFVKLAFSVAAHLDSEIMIMDEVLAVGDMAFQTKCLDRMREAAKKEGRTVLYVSHNMNTIRRMCDRCIVLDKGRIIFDGDVESAIEIYMDRQMNEDIFCNYENAPRPDWLMVQKMKLLEMQYVNKESVNFDSGEPMRIRMKWRNLQDLENISLRIEVLNLEEAPQGTDVLNRFYSGKKGEIGEAEIELDLSMIMDAEYKTYFTFFEKDRQGNNADIEWQPGLCFHKSTIKAEESWVWVTQKWGHIQFPSPIVRSFGSKQTADSTEP